MTQINIDRSSLRLKRGQYFENRHRKDLIVIHHTAGASESSSVAWWNRDPSRIATAVIIGRDGDVFETFPAEFWAYHLGVGGVLEKRSIGIELANWGGLTRSGSRYLNWAGREVPERDVYDAGFTWRGYRYWEVYPQAQVEAAIQATEHLLTRFGIPRIVAPPHILDGPDTRRYRAAQGVVAHHHVRADKTDISPAFPWAFLAESLSPAAPGHAQPLARSVTPTSEVLEPLARGARGVRVGALQSRLATLGFYRGRIDEAFGPATEEAVRRFQLACGLAVDGVAGPRTMARL